MDAAHWLRHPQKGTGAGEGCDAACKFRGDIMMHHFAVRWLFFRMKVALHWNISVWPFYIATVIGR